MKKYEMISKALFIMAYITFNCHIFAMDEEYNNNQKQLTIYDGWEIIDDSDNASALTVNREEDFELKAKALCNTALTFLGGAAVTICNFGIGVIENKIQRSVNQFDAGVSMGTFMAGNIYGHGLALSNSYEDEKNRLKKN